MLMRLFFYIIPHIDKIWIIFNFDENAKLYANYRLYFDVTIFVFASYEYTTYIIHI